MAGVNQSNQEAWTEGAGEYRGRGGAGYARVHVRRCENNLAASISVELDEHAWNDQLKSGAFQDWIAAALFGCRHACDVVGIQTGRWEIRRIVGLLVDTTAPFIAIAAARAVWKVYSYPATDAETERLTEVACKFHYERPENPE